MAESSPRSPLAALDLAAVAAPGDAGVLLRERPFLGKLLLHGDARHSAFVNRVWQVLELDLPTVPGRSAWRGGDAVLSLGPDEWLIVTPRAAEAPALAARLEDALRGQEFALVDQSSGRAVIRLAGVHARDVLAAGCALDLDPPAFDIGRCAQTRLGAFAVILHQVEPATGEAPLAYDLVVGRSYTLSLWQWLEQAGREFGVSVVP